MLSFYIGAYGLRRRLGDRLIGCPPFDFVRLKSSLHLIEGELELGPESVLGCTLLIQPREAGEGSLRWPLSKQSSI